MGRKQNVIFGEMFESFSKADVGVVVRSLRLRNVFLCQRLDEIFPEFVLLLAVGQGLHGAKAVDDVAGLAEVYLVQRIPEKLTIDSITKK